MKVLFTLSFVAFVVVVQVAQGRQQEQQQSCSELGNKECRASEWCFMYARKCIARPIDQKDTPSPTLEPTGTPTIHIRQCRRVKSRKICERRDDCNWGRGGCGERPTPEPTSHPTVTSSPTIPTPEPTLAPECGSYSRPKYCRTRVDCIWRYGKGDDVGCVDKQCDSLETVGDCETNRCVWDEDGKSGSICTYPDQYTEDDKACLRRRKARGCVRAGHCVWVKMWNQDRYTCRHENVLGNAANYL